MPSQVLPFDSTDPHYTVTVPLEGARYVFCLDWNAREEAWYLSINDLENEPILSGLRIVADWTPLRRFHYLDNIPPGEILILDTSGEGMDPGRNDLGDRVLVLYFAEADL